MKNKRLPAVMVTTKAEKGETLCFYPPHQPPF